MTPEIEVYETTLRDGTQREGVTFSSVQALVDSLEYALLERGMSPAPIDTMLAHP